MKQWMRWAIGLLLPLAVLLIPRSWIPIDGLTIMEHRVIALFMLAMCFWVFEPIPIFATSVVVIVISLLCMSDSAFIFLRPSADATPDQLADFGKLLSYKQVMATMADPIIMLFLGGFFLGAAATKYQLDTNLGRVFLKPFGTRTHLVMLGMMVITAVFSMFMSNTATTAMMLAVLMPVLRSIDKDDPARIGFALAIPFAANVGGIGTPIGTPPNAVALKYLKDAQGHNLISFAQWMYFAVPYVIVLLVISWLLLVVMFKPRSKHIHVEFNSRWLKTGKAYIVYITSAVTILLWLTGASLHGLSSTVVAMIPVGVFCATGIITASDLKQMGWDVLWLVAGGFALGLAMEHTGLSAHLVAAIPFDQMPAVLIMIIGCLLTFTMANFMSHTATSNLILPIMAALAVGLSDALAPLGGKTMLLIAVTFAASLSMSMPISTPPNAMAYATGWIRTGDMAKSGLATGIVGLLLVAVMVMVLNSLGVFAPAG